MAERPHLSIGELLLLLREEFPDVTISKIRFLESQGLVDPERTPSGYRKFYDADVERLRWILRQQRENFLPLKIIKGRLGAPAGAVAAAAPTPAVAAGPAAGPAPVAQDIRPPQEIRPPQDIRATQAGPPRAAASPELTGSPTASLPPASLPPASQPPFPPPRPPEAAAPAAAPAPPAPSPADVLSVGPSGAHLTFEELCAASGLVPERLRELERFGLVVSRPVAGSVYYDDEAMVVARLAAGFLRFGVEARHLRIYKSAAEREAGFFEQIVTPLMKQRNPQARRQAVESLVELSRLGEGLRASMLRRALKDYTGP